MAFQKVEKAPTQSETQRKIGSLKRQYRRLEKKWDSAKYQFSQAIGAEDFEVLTVKDFLELKELYLQRKKLYWKIYQLEHPEDVATVEAYKFLNRMSHTDQFDFLMKLHMTTHDLIHAIEENPNFIEEVTA